MKNLRVIRCSLTDLDAPCSTVWVKVRNGDAYLSNNSSTDLCVELTLELYALLSPSKEELGLPKRSCQHIPKKDK